MPVCPMCYEDAPLCQKASNPALVCSCAEEVDRIGEALSDYIEPFGVSFKRLKSRKAAWLQLVLGFWWDSIARTRTLETAKLDSYLVLTWHTFGRWRLDA